MHFGGAMFFTDYSMSAMELARACGAAIGMRGRIAALHRALEERGFESVWATRALAYPAVAQGTFNKTYGSLGAVIGFMTWMWLSVVVILIGGKLNAEMEHQTARDSTEGVPSTNWGTAS